VVFGQVPKIEPFTLGVIDLGSGAAQAMPIWSTYMQKVTKDNLIKIVPEWEAPKAPLTIELNCDNYKPEEKGKSNSFIEE
jgi:penicillin-binding protein 1A